MDSFLGLQNQTFSLFEQASSARDTSSALQEQVEGLKEEALQLKREKVRRDNTVKELKTDLSKKLEQVSTLEQTVVQLQSQQTSDVSDSRRHVVQMESEVRQLRGDLSRRDGELSRTQSEVDRLLDIMRTTEDEKNEKDKLIKDLNECVPTPQCSQSAHVPSILYL